MAGMGKGCAGLRKLSAAQYHSLPNAMPVAGSLVRDAQLVFEKRRAEIIPPTKESAVENL